MNPSLKLVLVLGALALLCLTTAEKCKPGESFMKKCNYCTCTPDGESAACTLMACHEGSKRMLRSSGCTPGEHFKDDCNDCTCSDDGKTARCTLKDCKPIRSIPPEGDKCIPGTKWKDECNSCFCTEGGISACTLMACLRTDAGPIVVPGL